MASRVRNSWAALSPHPDRNARLRSTHQAQRQNACRKNWVCKVGLCAGLCHTVPMNAFRHVKLFKNGRNQAVRIPREFELPGEDAIMRRDGDKLIIEPAPAKSLLAVLAALSPIEDAFPEIEDRPPEPVDL